MGLAVEVAVEVGVGIEVRGVQLPRPGEAVNSMEMVMVVVMAKRKAGTVALGSRPSEKRRLVS